MAATDETTIEVPSTTAAAKPAVAMLVCLGAGYTDAQPEQIAAVLQMLRQALALTQSTVGAVTVTFPSSSAAEEQDIIAEQDGFSLRPYATVASAQALTVHTAGTWLSLAGVVRAYASEIGLLLGVEAHTLAPEAVAGMVDAVVAHGVDLALPHYVLPQNQGLLNESVLAPLSRALFTAQVRFPLPLDCAFSARMAERMAQVAQRVPAASQAEVIVWPVDEAAVAGYELAEIGNTTRELPVTTGDLGQILRDVAGSLFADIEAKATFWQRTRTAKETLRLDAAEAATAVPATPADDEEIDELLASFRIGYSNLHDIWSLVLPPQTLVSLKRLSQATRENFALQDTVWVRIMYDFVLAHRLRTLSRGHLMGALTPLYLAWVASHLLALRNGNATGGDALSRAFEADRPYLVSRWRWPDRFNP